ncbi:hypothetical protein ACFPIJ_54050 [Dactylosporangium cerinum]|uniref:Uncharacterized protein n=1 Tax=Dactylosporangium cerinum TaxID=1434730 RepID=A0ABV9WGT9_9ACTN
MPVKGLLYLAAAGAAGLGGIWGATLLKRTADAKIAERPSDTPAGATTNPPPTVMLYLAVAGALRVGGPFAAIFFLLRAGQELATDLRLHDLENETRILQARISMEHLRQQASDLGINPDLAARGYQDLRDGLFSLDKITPFLKLAGIA